MAELADDEDAVFVDSSGALGFEQTSELDAYRVGDQLEIGDITDSFTQTLGVFSVDSPGSQFTSVTLREIFSEADMFDGQTVIVPGFDFSTKKKALNSFDSFALVVIESGQIQIEIDNQMAIPLGSPIRLELWDTFSDSLVLQVDTNDQIPPGSSKDLVVDLAGKRLSNTLSIRMIASSPGSGGDPVLVDADSRFDMGGMVSSLEVREAVARIPRQIVSRNDVITISDSIVVMEAQLESGTIELDLSGDLPLDAWLLYELPDFYDSSGEAFGDSLFINQNSPVTEVIDLGDKALRPAMAGFNEQEIKFNWTIKTIDTGLAMVRVRSTDVMDAAFGLRDVIFSEVTGKLGEQRIEVTQDDIEFDIPADLDSIFFATAQLELVINNRINFPAHLSFEIEGENAAGSVSYLSVDETIQPASTPGQTRQTVVVLNQNNSNITEFISILPSLIRINGGVKLGDANWVGTVSRDDYVDGEVRISAPFAVRLPTQTIDSEPDNLNIDDDVQNDIIDNLGSGEFFAEIKNHLPLGASVEIMFGATEDGVFENPLLQIGPLRADGAAVNGAGYVDVAANSNLTFALTEEQMRTFVSDSLYSGVRIFLDGTDSEFVRVRSEDFIEIKSYTQVKIRVNQD